MSPSRILLLAAAIVLLPRAGLALAGTYFWKHGNLITGPVF